jgi:MFS family permease
MIPRLPKTAWVVLGADALAALGSGMTLPFLLIYLHTVRGLALAPAGLAVSTVALASLIGNPLGGWLGDRYGARDALICGLVISAAGALLLAAISQPWQAFAATAAIGLGASISWPAQDTLLAALTGTEQRSSAFSVRHATLNAGLGVGALLATTIVDTHHPHTFTLLYLTDAATFLASIPILASAPHTPTRRPQVRGEDPQRPSFAAVSRDRVFARVWLLCALVVAISYGQLQSAFPAFATRPGGIPAASLSLAYAANSLTIVAGQLLTLRLLRGRTRTTAITLASGIWALAWSITLIAGAFGGAGAAQILFATALATFALAETMLAPTFPAIVNDIAPEHLRGRYNGLSTLAWTTGFLIGPALAGAALAAHLATPLFLGLITLCGAAAVAATKLARHLPPAANRITAP